MKTRALHSPTGTTIATGVWTAREITADSSPNIEGPCYVTDEEDTVRAEGICCLDHARVIAAVPYLLDLVRRYRAATSRTGAAAVLVDRKELDSADADADRLLRALVLND